VNPLKWLIPLGLLAVLALACNFPALLSQPAPPEPAAVSGATPTAVSGATFTPTPSPSPTPTPTPTPLPAARVSLGDQALLYGDWQAARNEYQTALESSPDLAVQSAARLGLAHTLYLEGAYDEARVALQDLVDGGGDPAVVAQASFFLAQTLDAQQRYQEAAEAYNRYLELRPGLIDGYVQELRGDAFMNAGEYASAIGAYQAALGAPRLGDGEHLELQIARAYDRSGDLATALVAYQDIYNRSSNDYTKAALDLRMGQIYTELGQIDEAQAAYLDAVMNFPLSYDAYSALLALVEAGVPVDELQRGLVDYHAGQYGVALAAFDRYLQSDPADPATALYYTGLSQAGLGSYPGAIETFDRLIQSYPDSEWWDEAWDQKAYLLWYRLGEFRQAGDVLLEFVELSPTHPRAAEFLFDAALIAERADRLDRAARLWGRVAGEYPASEQANRALFLAGITRYRLADYVAAHDLFQQILARSDQPEPRAAAFLWMGKSQQALQNLETARADWTQAAALDPTGYYSERARDLLLGNAPFTPPQQYDLSFDLQAERVEAENWMRTVFDLPEGTDISGLGALADDPRFQRGNELWHLGLYDEARAEFEDLRTSVENDPAATYRLAGHLHQLGLYRSAILAARRVLTLAGMDDAASLKAPIFFNHIRFGPYYRDLVIAASRTYDFHPLFLFSVIRQESLFEGFVRSSADARGLMQIIPATGAELAANAGWPEDYTPADLYRPLVSLNLGANYLHRQRAFLSGDIYAALAAYNGGPGNAAAWKDLVPPDPDLFLEVIRFEETRNYVRRIYENFNIYRELYDRTP
jgi:soluble lytic murein transglycosylase